MKCDTKNCRNDMDLIDVGKNLCNDCWKKKCRQEEKAWEEEHGRTTSNRDRIKTVTQDSGQGTEPDTI